ncbi:Uncharacterised protein [Mycobacteroides abscessus subsp. abscessus]|nr:Uncharacterised protein [Mycobacteroides abscessus subsp. abscessus]
MAPSSHSASKVSGLNLPVLVISLTSAQILSAGAAICTVTESRMASRYSR